MPSDPARPSVDGPLDRVNDAFHEFYEAAREIAETEPPIIVVLADSLVLFRDAQRRELSYSPRLFHVLKSAAHAPIALYSALSTARADVLDGAVEKKVRQLGEHVQRSLACIDADVVEAASKDDVRAVLATSLTLIEKVLLQHTISAAQRAELAALGPTLRRLIEAATRIQLASLHAAVMDALASLSADERRQLQVVVTGDHQARVRSLGMQYFRKLLREPEGSEERVTYAEGVNDEREARALVGTRRFDRALAATFFGDPKRLQRDLLGDAAKVQLSQLDIEPIV
jgi:hypothetical protein